MSARHKILDFLASGYKYTAAEIARCLGLNLASVSSLLKKMCDELVLDRLSGVGPRGGFGYGLRSK